MKLHVLRFSEGRYGKRFKYSKVEQGETPAQFAQRLKARPTWRNGEKWQVNL